MLSQVSQTKQHMYVCRIGSPQQCVSDKPDIKLKSETKSKSWRKRCQMPNEEVITFHSQIPMA